MQKKLVKNRFCNENIGKISYKQQEDMEAMVEHHVGEILNQLLIDWKKDHNMKDTPKRVAKMLIQETFVGRYEEPPKITDFPNVSNLDQLMAMGPIDVKSTCAHHLQPIYGKAWVGVLPHKHGRIIGLSKFNRIVDHFSRRPQIQEELTSQIADYLQDLLKPKGLIIMVKARHFCFSPDTEVLTEMGWKRFDEYDGESRVAQVDMKTMEATLVKPTIFFKKKNDLGSMLHLESHKADLLVTPDHRVYFKYGSSKKPWRVDRADALPKDFYLPARINWVDGKPVEAKEFDGVTINPQDLCSILGIYCADGRVVKNRFIEIIQKEGDSADRIRELFQRVGLISHRSGYTQKSKTSKGRSYIEHIVVKNKDLADYCFRFGRLSIDRRVPKIIRRGTKQDIEYFIEWYYLGDGDKFTGEQQRYGKNITTASKKMVNDLQLLLFKLGKITKIHSYEGAEYQNKGNKYRVWEQVSIDKNDGVHARVKEEIPYSGYVYGVSVPNKAIIVRRNGKIVVTGNCMCARGVNQESDTVTSVAKGKLRENNLKSEFFNLIKQ